MSRLKPSATGLKPWLAFGLPLAAVVLVGWAIYWLGWWQQGAVHVVLWQRDLYHALTSAITEIDRAPGVTTWGVLLGVSFGYGVFHAAGPGHGKVVLSTYLASQGGAWKRAIALSALASLLQGVMAIALIAVLVFGLGWLTRQAMASVDQAETVSFLLVALVGLWLCVRSLRRLYRATFAGSAVASEPAALTGRYRFDVVAPRNGTTLASHRPDPFVRSAAPAPGANEQGANEQGADLRGTHEHGAHCGCGHDHHVDPDTASDWRGALLTVLSIGIRPCSGAVLLLGASALLGQFGKGVVAVMAMSLGTALTVSSLALLSVFARDWVQRRLSPMASRHPWQAWVGLAGGALILALGLSLSLAQWQRGEAPGAPLLGSPTAQSTEAPVSGPFTRG
ncbi:nickel/cobalt transporter [Salinicola halophilus]|uniref:nickel/cobalt transporter n=1 Tax=Salinicola halophilus TaxID=184065 RepID=UPI000DA12E86|nr:nickel/cobalt transporter [Salinicola halophilus]